jgi:hypothetical protein
MKTPATAPMLTRAQIDAIVSAGMVHPDSQSARTLQTAVTQAAVAAAASYGCVDWYIYPDSDTESDSDASDAQAA